MPRANVYLQKEDWDKWQALPNKSEFVRQALNYPKSKEVHAVLEKKLRSATDPDGILRVKQNIYLCQHGAAESFCTVSGCEHYQFKKGGVK